MSDKRFDITYITPKGKKLTATIFGEMAKEMAVEYLKVKECKIVEVKEYD